LLACLLACYVGFRGGDGDLVIDWVDLVERVALADSLIVDDVEGDDAAGDLGGEVDDVGFDLSVAGPGPGKVFVPDDDHGGGGGGEQGEGDGDPDGAPGCADHGGVRRRIG